MNRLKIKIKQLKYDTKVIVNEQNPVHCIQHSLKSYNICGMNRLKFKARYMCTHFNIKITVIIVMIANVTFMTPKNIKKCIISVVIMTCALSSEVIFK